MSERLLRQYTTISAVINGLKNSPSVADDENYGAREREVFESAIAKMAEELDQDRRRSGTEGALLPSRYSQPNDDIEGVPQYELCDWDGGFLPVGDELALSAELYSEVALTAQQVGEFRALLDKFLTAAAAPAGMSVRFVPGAEQSNYVEIKVAKHLALED